MISLDDPELINRFDSSDVLGSITHLPQQCQHAWEDTQNIPLPPDYHDFKAVVMTGVGGSGLGARIIESVYADSLPVPLVRLNNYDLPGWVDNQTLVICSSFSGTTEEPVQTAHQAQEKGAKWMVIASGGTLIDLAQKNNRPYYQINPTHNPSKEPRMAIGYSVIGQLVLAAKANLIQFDHSQIDSLIPVMDQVIKENHPDQPTSNNPAKQLAQQLESKLLELDELSLLDEFSPSATIVNNALPTPLYVM